MPTYPDFWWSEGLGSWGFSDAFWAARDTPFIFVIDTRVDGFGLLWIVQALVRQIVVRIRDGLAERRLAAKVARLDKLTVPMTATTFAPLKQQRGAELLQEHADGVERVLNSDSAITATHRHTMRVLLQAMQLFFVGSKRTVSYTHLTLPTIYSV